MHLQAIWLSALCTGSSKVVTSTSWFGECVTKFPHQWPWHAPVSQADWQFLAISTDQVPEFGHKDGDTDTIGTLGPKLSRLVFSTQSG